MLTPNRGDTMVRVVPPIDGSEAYVQFGTVDRITDDTIELLVQVDHVRRMRFRRIDGMDTEGIGSFVIPGKMWRPGAPVRLATAPTSDSAAGGHEPGRPMRGAAVDAFGAAGDMRCNCRRCIETRGDTIHGFPRLALELIVCPTCGDKRCVHAWDHQAPCAKADLYAHNTWVENNLVLAPLLATPEGGQQQVA